MRFQNSEPSGIDVYPVRNQPHPCTEGQSHQYVPQRSRAIPSDEYERYEKEQEIRLQIEGCVEHRDSSDDHRQQEHRPPVTVRLRHRLQRLRVYDRSAFRTYHIVFREISTASRTELHPITFLDLVGPPGFEPGSSAPKAERIILYPTGPSAPSPTHPIKSFERNRGVTTSLSMSS